MKRIILLLFILATLGAYAQSPEVFITKNITVNKVPYTVEVSTKTRTDGVKIFGITLYNDKSPRDEANIKPFDYLTLELFITAIKSELKRIDSTLVLSQFENEIFTQSMNVYMVLNVQRDDIDDLSPESGNLLVHGKVKIQYLSTDEQPSKTQNKKRKKTQGPSPKTFSQTTAIQTAKDQNDGLKKKYDEIKTDDKKKDEAKKAEAEWKKAEETFNAIKNDTAVISKVSIEFDEGYIERIKVYVEYGGQTAVYRNLYAIPFSRKLDYTQMNDMKLFSDKSATTTDYIKVGDLLSYDYYLEVKRRDYSPTDGVVTIENKGANKAQVLHAEPTSEIFSGRIYTDLEGVQNSNPNGLVQIEIDKKFKMLLKKYPMPSEKNSTSRSSFAMFSYGIANVGLNKIEQKARYLNTLQKNDVVAGELASFRYASTLDILRYRNFNAGIRINVMMFDMPNLFSKLHINAGFDYGLTPFSDSVVALNKTTGAIEKNNSTRVILGNNVSWMVDWLFEIRHNERWGINLLGTVRGLYLLNNEVRNIYDLNKFETTGKDYKFRSILTVGGELFFRPDKSGVGELYGRVLVNMYPDQPRTNFAQIQVGYKFFLMKKDKIKPKQAKPLEKTP